MLQKVDRDRLDTVLRLIEKYKIRFPVAKLSKELNKGKSEVSIYLSGKKPMSENFYETFLNKYPDIENKSSEEGDTIPYYSRDNADLHSLIMSNVTLSQAQMKLAETNAELTGMLKAVLPVTATDKKEMIEVLNTNMRGLLDAIADVAMGKKFPSKQAALMELSKTVHASHKKVKEAGSLTSSHK